MSGVDRWRAFLGSVKSRHATVLEEAHEGCLALFEQSDSDFGPLTSAWTAMNIRAQNLESKIGDTWCDQVEPLLEAEGHEADALQGLEAEGIALAGELETHREHVRVDLYARAARRLHALARAEQASEVGCTQCGAPIEVPDTFVSLNLTCTRCGAVNTFEPGARVRAIASTVIPALLDEATLSEADARRAAEAALSNARGEPEQLVDALEQAHRVYWSKRLRLQSTWENRTIDLQKEIDMRLATFASQYR